jgi:ethanolamine utilization cobalamin adenosyltransferase
MEQLQAKVQTKSNYRNLNGKWVTILQFMGTIVYCKTIDETDTEVTFDLNLNEIKEIISLTK